MFTVNPRLAFAMTGKLVQPIDPIITITDLHFRYKKAARPVFRGLNLSVRPGERLVILGPSEAGKSTLALCLQGLIPRMIKGDFRGEITVDGVLTTSCRPRQLAGRVGILLQDFEAQLFSTRVDQEVAFGPENLGLPQEELRRRVAECLALAGLAGLDDRDPATLSGGQRQLLALAAVLALAPKLLVLDEPTTDLDPLRVEELLASLDQLGRTRGLTLIFLGEDLRLARFCTRVVLLNRGKILGDGPPEVILREVELLRTIGLAPPELPALFHDLGQPTLPLSLEEAVSQARGLGWSGHPAATSPAAAARGAPGPRDPGPAAGDLCLSGRPAGLTGFFPRLPGAGAHRHPGTQRQRQDHRAQAPPGLIDPPRRGSMAATV